MTGLGLSDFVRRCPESASLFVTDNCDPKNIIAKTMCLYASRQQGSGRHQVYPAATWRGIVAHRLVGNALAELTSTRGGLNSLARPKLAALVVEEMPDVLEVGTDYVQLFVIVDEEIRHEMNGLPT